MDTEKMTVPAGTYYMGDPCYLIEGEKWSRWVTEANLGGGRFLGEVDGYPVVGLSALLGDGSYESLLKTGNKLIPLRHNHSVDSGIIGLIPWELCEKLEEGALTALSMGSKITSVAPLQVWAEPDGVLHFDTFCFKTGD